MSAETGTRWSRYPSDCPYEGCYVRSTLVSYREKHADQPHSECSCGWVGPYWKMHVSSQRRVGNTGEHVRLGPARKRAESDER